MSFGNRNNEDVSAIAYIFIMIAIAIIAFMLLLAAITAILWFVEWLPATFGWAGILLFACIICYIFYKYV